MIAPGIELERISLAYDGQALFTDFSLMIPAGRTTCLLGPSGCGKSTLLKLLAGAPDLAFTGTIRLDPQPDKAVVAWMSQNDLLLPWLTMLDNVCLGARLRGELTESTKEKALALIAQAGLTGYETSYPSALSGGMRQRTALLRTLMEERPIILMDEPFSALDALNRVRLQNLAAHLTQGATVVLVTHDPLEALRLGHCIVVLNGSPASVVAVMEPQDCPPREPGSAELAQDYAALLGLLMNGEAA